MKRPLRSVLIGDVDFYASEFAFGINQGMTLLGHWHSTINIRQDISLITRRLEQVRPEIVWGHMLLWSPGGEHHTSMLLSLLQSWHAQGVKVLIHDGDARPDTRFPYDVSSVIDVVLCNHTADRSVWGIKQVRWPYFAFVQQEIADPVDEFKCDLLFAGRFGGGIYAGRTALVHALQERLEERMKVFPTDEVPHTLFRTPEVAASAGAILGYARPDSPGWLDVRVFQYPGAGGVLLYDGDTTGYLEPFKHYIPYRPGDVASVLEAISIAQQIGDGLRHEAFSFVQRHHSSVTRVEEALRVVGLHET